MTPVPVEQPVVPTVVLTAAPSRQPWVRREVIIAPLVVLAALWTVLLTGVLDDTWGGGQWISTPSILLVIFSYNAWAVDRGRVTVEEHDVVLRPGRVLNHRFRIQDVISVVPGTTRWRGASLKLRDGRAAGLPSLSEQDVQRLGELLQAAAGRGSAPGTASRSGAAPHRANVIGAAPHRARTRSAGGISAGAGPSGAVRAPGAARWPDPPGSPDPPSPA